MKNILFGIHLCKIYKPEASLIIHILQTIKTDCSNHKVKELERVATVFLVGVVRQVSWILKYWLHLLQQKKGHRPLSASCLSAERSRIVFCWCQMCQKLHFKTAKSLYRNLLPRNDQQNSLWTVSIEDCFFSNSNLFIFEQKDAPMYQMYFSFFFYLFEWHEPNDIQLLCFGTMADVSAAQVAKTSANQIKAIDMERYHWG